MSFRRPLALPLLVLLASPALADDIHLIDGTAVNDASVSTEGLKEVEYRADGKKQTVAADQVLRIDFSAMPTLVDRAENAVRDEQVADAIADLETYVGGFLSGGKENRHEWAPAYAAYRLVQLNRMVGEADAAIAAADRVIASFAESRYLPLAYVDKAEIQALKGDASKALATLKDFKALVQSKGLSKRWELEGELARVRIDPSLKGSAKRDALAELSSKAGRTWPTVRNAADVAEAESHLEAKDTAKAEKIFQRIVDDSKALPSTLAAAHTGLGECLFQRAANSQGTEAEKLRQDALLHFMRVVVVTPGETTYVPKAMFYAARIFDMATDAQSKDNAQKLYLSILRIYDGTNWATEARGFRRR